MAFVLKVGKRFQVRKGNSGTETLATFGSQKAADAEVARLHAKHDPQARNRGASAGRRLATQIAAIKTPGVMGTAAQESQSSGTIGRAIARLKK